MVLDGDGSRGNIAFDGGSKYLKMLKSFSVVPLECTACYSEKRDPLGDICCVSIPGARLDPRPHESCGVAPWAPVKEVEDQAFPVGKMIYKIAGKTHIYAEVYRGERP